MTDEVKVTLAEGEDQPTLTLTVDEMRLLSRWAIVGWMVGEQMRDNPAARRWLDSHQPLIRGLARKMADFMTGIDGPLPDLGPDQEGLTWFGPRTFGSDNN